MTRLQGGPSILYIITEDWFFKSHFVERAVAAQKAGFSVSVATRFGPDAEEIRSLGIELIPLDLSRRGLNPLKEATTVLSIARLLHRVQPDVVHNVALKPVVLGTLAGRLVRVRGIINAPVGMGYVFSSNETKASILRPLLRGLLRLSLSGKETRTVIENKDDLRDLVQGGFVKPDSIHLIRGAGVNVEAIVPSSEPEIETVVLIARMLRDKGVQEFAEAARRLKVEYPRAKFLLVGSVDPGNPTSMNEVQLREIERIGAVKWAGYTDDIPSLLRECTIVCLPSYREGLPKALIEAAAAGRPIVTCDVPGCREVVEHEVNGLLVPPRDPDALATALGRLLGDPALRRRYGDRGRERALNEFADTLIISQTLEIYRSVAERSVGTAADVWSATRTETCHCHLPKTDFGDQ